MPNVCKMERNNSYISCMKINGHPILPPLITLRRKRELQEYKSKAIHLEELYKNRKIKENGRQDSNKKKLETLFHRSPSVESIPSLIDFTSPSKYVPYKNISNPIIFNSDTEKNECFSLVNHFENSIFHTECELTASGIDLDIDKSVSVDEGIYDKSGISSSVADNVLATNFQENKEVDKPRLIRSNSYTLDNPSPILLEHMKRQHSVSFSDQISAQKNSKNFDSSLLESLCQEKSTSNSSIITELILPSEIKTSTKCSKLSETVPSNLNGPSVEVVTTDITVQQINITAPINESFGEKELLEILNNNSNDKTLDNAEDPEEELNLVLKQIPEVYSRKILELIEKQKLEQQKRVQNYENLKKNLLEHENNNNNVSSYVKSNINRINVNSAPKEMISDNVEIVKMGNFENSERLLMSSLADSVSLNLDTTCSESLDDFSVRTVKNLDSEEEIDNNSTEYRVSEREERKGVLKNINNRHCTFQDNLSDGKIFRLAEKDRAASIIGAYVRGYLVRRLMKTAKIQTLKRTIQDALVCALELQNSDNIEEADVELHRRLIQQVSAACYEFYDVFFGLTIPEQMDLIAIDREKRKRPISARNSRSSLEFQVRKSKSTSNVRLSKSLTKV